MTKYPKLANEALNRLSVEDYQNAPKLPVIAVLDNVRSHNNVGSVFRSADAFALEAVYLCGYTGTPPHRDIQKTALGATDSVNWKYFDTTLQAIEALKAEGYIIAAIEQAEGRTWLQDLAPKAGAKIAVVLGNEVMGVSDEVMEQVDIVLEIPQYGTKHSLNISVTAGIVFWQLRQVMGS